MPSSQWGTLRTLPAWLLHLRLQFGQPSGYKLANAKIELVFTKADEPSRGDPSLTKLGPIVTSYFGPKTVSGEVADPRRGAAAFQAAAAEAGDELEQWALRAYTWPIEGDNTGLHRRVEWIVREARSPYQTVLHRDQVSVGLVLEHDLEPFFVAVRIEGELQQSRRWFRFPRISDAEQPSVSVRVAPCADPAHALDEVARQLNKTLTAQIVVPRSQSTNSVKRARRAESDETAAHVQEKKPKRSRAEPAEPTEPGEPGELPCPAAPPPRRCEDYAIGWICALPVELAAAQAMLQEAHPRLPAGWNDPNNYLFGSIGMHNVIITSLPAGVYGTTSAATVAAHMQASFPHLKFFLMVGIGGGVPSEDADLRLGDIVVSKPKLGYGGVVQYDYGKAMADGSFQVTGALNKPPQALLATLARLEAEDMVNGSQIVRHLENMVTRYPHMSLFTRPEEDDILFEADYVHPVPTADCSECDHARALKRLCRASDAPRVHCGLIASGNSVMKDAMARDKLAQSLGIICFEMEAAGLMDSFPCLTIRGVCDYADSHKNKTWQSYAAATAAAYAKELLCMLPVRQVELLPTKIENMPGSP
ncbi:purine and uridine phosphorylase [Aspergillus uvarum CBS 121591]|uniref:Purine and uridine phosphorylase n=1 Tax=Aspergillus uvarum CBS 121591 TaxID=1448315 RepID=A0A319BY06_9EURO|nr:purine and uridine phosphorylase [Aspergillus uvarum CBS 121591]PYH77605.1 purine and uridine phosphorylase [Aspergillus uvarum CBS 121591]